MFPSLASNPLGGSLSDLSRPLRKLPNRAYNFCFSSPGDLVADGSVNYRAMMQSGVAATRCDVPCQFVSDNLALELSPDPIGFLLHPLTAIPDVLLARLQILVAHRLLDVLGRCTTRSNSRPVSVSEDVRGHLLRNRCPLSCFADPTPDCRPTHPDHIVDAEPISQDPLGVWISEWDDSRTGLTLWAPISFLGRYANLVLLEIDPIGFQVGELVCSETGMEQRPTYEFVLGPEIGSDLDQLFSFVVLERFSFPTHGTTTVPLFRAAT